MAFAGISPSKIFSTLATIDLYGALQDEAKKIAKEINVMGIDHISALKHAIDISPSPKFKSFLQGMIGTIQAGSQLHVYLENIVDKYMEEDIVHRKKDLDLLAIIAEVFVIAVIAFPVFLVIILTVFGFFGGSMDLSITILILFSLIILPIIYVCFYFLIASTSLEKISKIHRKKTYTFKDLYHENKLPFLIVLISTIFIVGFYVILFGFSAVGSLNLTLYSQLDFVFLAILFLIGPIGFFYYLELKKKKEIQRHLPDFLIEVGDSLNTGMTIFNAIKVSSKAHYGRLSNEIKRMKAQLSWGISIKEVFINFAERTKSAIVQRIIITINRGLIMGGNTSKIFKAASREVDQVNQLENQRQVNMSIYTIVILLCFFVFLAIIVILDLTIFTSFFEIQESQSVQIGSFVLSVFDPLVLKYTLYSFVFVQSIGAGLLSGFMMDGNLSSGIRFSCILGLISFFVFKIVL
jgi:flagellar protein FlaJ